ncbi:MAG TPA: hypothetical protein DEQ28_01175 [Clostridiales bacterium]|nr:hypothetical protein [Clostridiales bacterium]
MASEKFLEAERVARELVDSLRKLKQEAGSYASAGRALDEVRGRLEGLIDSTRELASRTHDAVSVLGTIGGPEIVERLQVLEERSGERAGAQEERLSEIERGLQTLEDRVHGVRMAVYVTLALSAAGVVIALVAG